MSAALRLCGVPTVRERLWAAMRELRTFNTSELALKSKVDRRGCKIKEYVNSLVQAGILARIVTHPQPIGTFVRFELVHDMGVHAPRVRKDGSSIPDDGQTRMWKAMKILKTFSARDLVVYASLPDAEVADGTAAAYCRWLERGGYVSPLNSDVPRWRFVRDTGARAPQILRVKQLFDPNTGEVVTGEDVLSVLERDHGNA